MVHEWEWDFAQCETGIKIQSTIQHNPFLSLAIISVIWTAPSWY